MRVLVTGGAGFIGSNLVDAVVERGDHVLVVDDLSTGREANLESALGRGAELRPGSLLDREIAERVERFEPDQVFHLAAQIDVRRSVEDPGFDATVNVIGTINLLEAVRRAGSPPVVFTSTGGAIYGEGAGRELPFAETARAEPMAGYGASKLAGEQYLGVYRRLHGLPTLALRLANVYGPRQDALGEAGVVAIFCGRTREGKPLTVFGDGEQTRDYIYVGDVVDALLAAADALADRGTGLEGPFNVGTGRETSVLELVSGLERVAGVELEVEHQPERAGEVQRVAIDPGSIEREIGWRAGTDLADGLARTYAALAQA